MLCKGVLWCKRKKMESNYYRNLEYVDISYFPVLPEDYEGTSDRPGCEKPHWTPHYSTQVGLRRRSCCSSSLGQPYPWHLQDLLAGYVLACNLRTLLRRAPSSIATCVLQTMGGSSMWCRRPRTAGKLASWADITSHACLLSMLYRWASGRG